METLISYRNNHVFVCGTTRSGKTHFAGKALAAARHPVLFLNLVGADLPPKFFTLHAEEMDSIKDLIDLLKKGLKINLILPDENAVAYAVAGKILDSLMKAGFSEGSPVYVACDEVHLYEKYGKKKSIEVATRGLFKGVRGVFITQRPANCDKTIYNMATEQYLFRMSRGEKIYLQNKGLNFDQLEQIWIKYSKVINNELTVYGYAEFDGVNLIEHAPLN